MLFEIFRRWQILLLCKTNCLLKILFILPFNHYCTYSSFYATLCLYKNELIVQIVKACQHAYLKFQVHISSFLKIKSLYLIDPYKFRNKLELGGGRSFRNFLFWLWHIFRLSKIVFRQMKQKFSRLRCLSMFLCKLQFWKIARQPSIALTGFPSATKIVPCCITLAMLRVLSNGNTYLIADIKNW